MNITAWGVPLAAFSAAILLDMRRGVLASVRDPAHIASGFCSGTILGSAFFIFISQAVAAGGNGDFDMVLSLSGLGFVAALLIQRTLSSNSLLAERHRLLGRWLGRVGFAFALGCGARMSLICASIIAIAFLSRQLCIAISTPQPPASVAQAMRINLAGLITALLVYELIPLAFLHLSFTLSVIGGSFIYLGASILVPESHHAHSQWPTLGTTVAGALFVFWVVH